MLHLDRLELAQGDFRLLADLHIPRGSSVALLGPSGGGKSTLLAGIAGFLVPQSGRVLWEGQDLGPLLPGRRPISVLFQDSNLFPHLTALQNVALGLRPSLRPRQEERARASEALDRVGLAGLEERRPAQLSGGQQARAALARVLVQDRPLVLMDEPFGALGPALKTEMLDLTRDVLARRGATILMVTHDPDDAAAFAAMVIVVADGRAEGARPTGAVLADPPPALRAYLGRHA